MKKLLSIILSLIMAFSVVNIAYGNAKSEDAVINKCVYSNGIVDVDISIPNTLKAWVVVALYDSNRILKDINFETSLSNKTTVKTTFKNNDVGLGYYIKVLFENSLFDNQLSDAGKILYKDIQILNNKPSVPKDDNASDTTKEDNKSYATFFTGISSRLIDEYEEQFVVGYKNGKKVEYKVGTADISNVIVGKLGVSVSTLGGRLLSFIKVGKGKTFISEKRYTYGGKLTDVNIKNKRIKIDDKEFSMKDVANVYVYDCGAASRDRVKTDCYFDYLDIDSELGIYIDSDRTNLNVDAYVCLEDDKVIDLLYYINK